MGGAQAQSERKTKAFGVIEDMIRANDPSQILLYLHKT
jgi:hypothetical protein